MDDGIAAVLATIYNIFILKEVQKTAMKALLGGQYFLAFTPDWLWQEFGKRARHCHVASSFRVMTEPAATNLIGLLGCDRQMTLSPL